MLSRRIATARPLRATLPIIQRAAFTQHPGPKPKEDVWPSLVSPMFEIICNWYIIVIVADALESRVMPKIQAW
jgi:hypothetical protein